MVVLIMSSITTAAVSMMIALRFTLVGGASGMGYCTNQAPYSVRHGYINQHNRQHNDDRANSYDLESSEREKQKDASSDEDDSDPD